VLRVLDGVAKAAVLAMLNAIWDQVGTPQHPVAWGDPDSWIGQRLHGDDARLAERIWRETEGAVNPRYLRGAYLFLTGQRLLVGDAGGVFRSGERGARFLADDRAIVTEIDAREGIPVLLRILAAKGRARRADLVPDWLAFLQERSRFGTESTARDTLFYRLVNLAERGLVVRQGIWNELTPAGEAYLSAQGPAAAEPALDVLRLLRAHNDAVRLQLRERLATMPPTDFEELAAQLLRAMNYEDVVVTKASGDKGVDVTATIQMGITTVTEVVQVKRQVGSIQRPVLDQLRGVLPLHGAIRGTIITLGTFSKGCAEVATHRGAAPITLIDGERLLSLLVEHEMGIKRQSLTLLEVDDTAFAAEH
jgi:restriction system protein